jgi:hypothetical protein
MAKVLARPARPQVNRCRRLNQNNTTQAECRPSMAHQAPANRSRYGAVADARGETF